MPKAATRTTQVKQAINLNRKTQVVYGNKYWVESYRGIKIWIDPETMAAFDSTTLSGIGTWNDIAKTIRFE